MHSADGGTFHARFMLCVSIHCTWKQCTLVYQRALMGGAPYKFAKVGVGTLLSVSAFTCNHKTAHLSTQCP